MSHTGYFFCPASFAVEFQTILSFFVISRIFHRPTKAEKCLQSLAVRWMSLLLSVQSQLQNSALKV